MRRAIYFDVTHLSSRFWTDSPAGIDRIDMLFGGMVAEEEDFAGGVHHSMTGPAHVAPKRVAALVRRLNRRWLENLSEPALDPLFGPSVSWLTGRTKTLPAAGAYRLSGARHKLQRTLKWHFLYRHSFSSATRALKNAPRDSVYLNASQAGLTNARAFDWLARRPDVKAVFYVHDVLPLDHPEFFQPEISASYGAFTGNLARHASGIIVGSDDVADRLDTRLASLGRRDVPILVAPPPGPAAPETIAFSAELAAASYFVSLGTIEPRKNHLLLLNLWRFKPPGEPPPKLLIIGARGWHNQQILDILERGNGLSRSVAEIGGLSTSAAHVLLAHADGLLFPSFAEGFGLPVVEARALGTPVIASDIPVLRRAGGDGAIYRDPLDGPGWRDAIASLTKAKSPDRVQARLRAASGSGAARTAFTDRVRGFIDTI